MKRVDVVTKEQKELNRHAMTVTAAVDPDEIWLDRAGGISGLVLGIGYIIIAFCVPMGAPPSGRRAGRRHHG